MVRARASRLDAWAKSGQRQSSPEGVSDADLALRAKGGERWAEEALFRRYIDYVSALSFRLLRDRTEGEDVVQDTFLDAFAQLRAGTVPTSFRAWLAGIAVHKVHRRFRRRKLRALLGHHFAAVDGVLQTTAYAGTSPELHTELGLLDAALSVLPDVDRAAWMLRYVEGYELEEVARLCGCSIATVKRRIGRARAVVSAHVELDEVSDD
jgi:RNA polymerase sigma-70 factor (ECF subfamily)